IHAVENLPALEQVRSHFLGKKGQLTELLKQLSTLPPDQRSVVGQAVNQAKQTLLNALQAQEAHLKESALAVKLQNQRLDVTLPGRSVQSVGHLHPVTRIRMRLEQLFLSQGFRVIEGPEIEDDYHNFAALNFPLDHPARAMHDTFYFENGLLLRTHT